jgi:hypothetical protein
MNFLRELLARQLDEFEASHTILLSRRQLEKSNTPLLLRLQSGQCSVALVDNESDPSYANFSDAKGN